MAIDAVAQRSGVCSTSFVAPEKPRQFVGVHLAHSRSCLHRLGTQPRRSSTLVRRMECRKVRAVAEDLEVATRPGSFSLFPTFVSQLCTMAPLPLLKYLTLRSTVLIGCCDRSEVSICEEGDKGD